MNTVYPSRLAMSAAVVCACLFTDQATAGTMPAPSLPACHSTIEPDVTCRLPVKNGSFTALTGWEALGDVTLGSEGGASYLSMGHGSSIEQPVYAMFYKWSRAAYALRFRVRAESADAEVDAALYMSDDTGRHTQHIGSVMVTASVGEWRVVELVANGKPFPAPAHVLIKISNGGSGSSIQVTDVVLFDMLQEGAVDLR
ncbi:hypothetical protein [Luteibacter sp. UNCMF366Tsu5.1]|uniref:hypothetical protein n=1 Tax=Luteibacter sp. UNCMF366Tsu5.1 TaxID=1502758 RepID=UPI000908E61C|nr:hypothetical protein [Luteibacter sp. UNCMF366Tsu5.1]SFW60594.1 hypothetical protein SAMN02800691_2501 [Luteibacter sp. UNCMF366Tsu5.1]